MKEKELVATIKGMEGVEQEAAMRIIEENDNYDMLAILLEYHSYQVAKYVAGAADPEDVLQQTVTVIQNEVDKFENQIAEGKHLAGDH